METKFKITGLGTVASYDHEKYKKSFFKSDTYKNLCSIFPKNKLLGDIGIFSFEPSDYNYLQKRAQFIFPIIHADTFWYLDFIVSTNPKFIIDIGCGHNIIKYLISCMSDVKVIGFDRKMPDLKNNLKPDFIGLFTKDLVVPKSSKNYNIIAICSLHFVRLNEWYDRFMGIYNMLDAGNRALITINTFPTFKTTKFDPPTLLNIFNTETPSFVDIQTHIINELRKTPFEIMVADLTNVDGGSMNGNIRLVLERKKND